MSGQHASQLTDGGALSPKSPPYSHSAEQSVLGGLMLDNQFWEYVSDRLTAIDFYKPQHKIIFSALESLAQLNKPFDVLTVKEVIAQKSKLADVGGEVYLFELTNAVPTVANISAYADIVREKSVLRQLIRTSNNIAETAFNPDGRNIVELLDYAEMEVLKIGQQTQKSEGPVHIQKLLNASVEKIDLLSKTDGSITGISTGFVDFDKLTSGLQPSDLVIVAGRPSMGKTILGVNFAENAAIKDQKSTLIFSLEMPGDSIAMRMISSLGHIDQHKLRSGNIGDADWARISSAINMISAAPIYVDDTPNLSPADIRSRARRMLREHGEIGLIIVDYLQLMHVPGYRADNRTAEISEISRSLKALAKEVNAPVVALSQLNRSLEQRADKRPVMSDLRESGAIEQDADLIVFIYRDEVYHEDSQDKGVAEIIIAKHRNGPIGRVKLTFRGQYTRFENIAHTSSYT